jgi:putative zinc finger/helix-turn-helix YgiT family protein
MEEVMQCMQCGADMETVHEDRPHIDLGAITLRGVEVRRCSQCGEWEVVMPRLSELHRVMTAALLTKKARLAPAEIRFVRKAGGLSAGELGAAVGATDDAVSRWEQGQEEPAGSVDRLVRTIVASRLSLPLSVETMSRIGDTNEPLAIALRFGPAGWTVVDETDPVSVWRTSPREARRVVLDALEPARFAGVSDVERVALAVRAMLNAMTPEEA